ncbi:MAG: hypothetical protein IKK52_00465 [Alphaproteobacteria bacterium]|nr:hypothetical protein [Alphaproteobacteria bacterium]
MVNKLVTTIGRSVAKRTGSKLIEKINRPFEMLNQEVFGVKPLNVGERETLKCLQNSHNSRDYCKKVGDKVRNNYRKTGNY